MVEPVAKEITPPEYCTTACIIMALFTGKVTDLANVSNLQELKLPPAIEELKSAATAEANLAGTARDLFDDPEDVEAASKKLEGTLATWQAKAEKARTDKRISSEDLAKLNELPPVYAQVQSQVKSFVGMRNSLETQYRTYKEAKRKLTQEIERDRNAGKLSDAQAAAKLREFDKKEAAPLIEKMKGCLNGVGKLKKDIEMLYSKIPEAKLEDLKYAAQRDKTEAPAELRP